MVQVLHISNGDVLNSKLQAQGNRIDQQLGGGAADEEIVSDLFMAALSRQPTDAERSRLVAQLTEAPAAQRRQAIEDLYWSVLSSTEFLFNH